MDCPVAFHARENPDRIALLWGKRSLSWGNLNDYVHGTCRALKEIGVRPNNRFAVLSTNTLETIIILLSAWRAGASVLVLDPALSLSIGRKILDQYKIDLLFSDTKDYKAFSGQRRTVILNKVICKHNDLFLSHKLPGINPDSSGLLLVRNAAQELAAYNTVDYGQLFHCAEEDNQKTAYGSTKIWLLPFPLHHIWGQRILFRGLAGGGAIVLPEFESDFLNDPAQFSITLGFYKITHIFCPLVQLGELVRNSAVLASLRCLDAILVEQGSPDSTLLDKASGLSIPLVVSING
jgi:acyl-CoA synthetase (AMP-forming)/AMP-acid ligase II